MRPLVGILVSRPRRNRTPSQTRRRASRRRRTGVAYGVAVLIAALLLAARADAGVSGDYQLEFGFAKRALARETAAFCESTPNCVNWRLQPCRRQSWHRVDCLAHLYGANGVACSFVGIAVWPPWSNRLIIHRKRIVCS